MIAGSGAGVVGATGFAGAGGVAGFVVAALGRAGRGGRSTGAVIAGLGAVVRENSSSGPIDKLRTADGDSETDAVANFLNALGSGFADASSARSASRIRSSTIR